MDTLNKRVRKYKTLSVRCTGIIWLICVLMAVLDIFLRNPNSLFFQLFNGNTLALAIFAGFCFFRGSMAILFTPTYWRLFRQGVLKKDHNSFRFLFLCACTATWIAYSHFAGFSLPHWLMAWGIASWLWLIIPCLPSNNNIVPRKRLFDDDIEILRRHKEACRHTVNPANGLAMFNDSFDCEGNSFGQP